jgi:cytochrome c biogenesis protein
VLSLASLVKGSGEPGPRFAALTGDVRTALDDRSPAPGPKGTDA